MTMQSERRNLSTVDSRPVALAAVLIAVATALSPLSIPVGPTKVFPIQHMTNAIAGVLLGPVYAVFIAVVVGILRNALGTGTFFAFPGGIPGALVVGLLHKYLVKKDFTAFSEPVGTSVGGAVSWLIVQAGFIKSSLSLLGFISAFLASSIPGSILGFIVLVMIRRSGAILVPLKKR
jgi:energy coupling factor transporter S component ThiW